jgi:hypothetical protein
MAEEARTLYPAFVTLHDYLEEHHGDGSFDRMRRRLRERQGVLIDANPRVPRWRPTSAYVAALDAAAEVLGRPDFHEQYGRVACDYDLKVLSGLLTFMSSPEWLLHRAVRLWRRYHSTGTWELEYQPGLAKGTLRDFGVVHAGYCRVIQGWFLRAFEMAGARQVTMQHPRCRATGGDACVFLAAWAYEEKPEPPPRRTS